MYIYIYVYIYIYIYICLYVYDIFSIYLLWLCFLYIFSIYSGFYNNGVLNHLNIILSLSNMSKEVHQGFALKFRYAILVMLS